MSLKNRLACPRFPQKEAARDRLLRNRKRMNFMKRLLIYTLSVFIIQQLTAETFGLTIEDLLSNKRTAEVALARQVAMYIARNKTNEPLIQIAYAFNKKDHTNVIHACRRISDTIKSDMRVRSFVDNIVNKL